MVRNRLQGPIPGWRGGGNGEPFDNFGYSVGISGDTAVVTAPGRNVAGQQDQGAAYLFVRRGSAWVWQEPALIASDGHAGDAFGTSVAISGDSAIATTKNSATGASGAAYVFCVPCLITDAPPQGAAWGAAGGPAGDGGAFGTSGNDGAGGNGPEVPPDDFDWQGCNCSIVGSRGRSTDGLVWSRRRIGRGLVTTQEPAIWQERARVSTSGGA